MDDNAERAVERAIETMREQLGEQLTVDDIARSALFSKFHFSRVFQRATGVSPGRFLSALRLAEAKRLLVSTSTTVVDISHQVGYNSVGTFSTRFSKRVGISPAAYRRFGGVAPRIPAGAPADGGRATAVCGNVLAGAERVPGPIFLGLFRSRIPECWPVRYTVLDGPGRFTVPDVPSGRWHVIACALAGTDTDTHTDTDIRVGHLGPITVDPGITARLADVRLRRALVVDPPMLLALPDFAGTRVTARAAAI